MSSVSSAQPPSVKELFIRNTAREIRLRLNGDRRMGCVDEDQYADTVCDAVVECCRRWPHYLDDIDPYTQDAAHNLPARVFEVSQMPASFSLMFRR